MVSTEHDFIYDYTNDIKRLGATDLMKTITGVEITSEAMTQVAPYTIGHGNAFPFAVKPNAFKNGAPISEGRRWRDIIGELHGGGADPVIQLNHARTSKVPVDGEDDFHTQAYFSHLGSAGVGFDPDAPLSEGANAVLVEKDLQTGYRDVDFDAIELMNGPSMVSYAKLRADWFSLLRQGVRMTGTANSDSHIAAQIVAAPRTMVRVGDDRLSGFSEEVFLEAVRGGKAYGTTGPLIDVRLGDAGIGDQFSGTQGDLRVTILPSSWVNVSELRIYVNGVEVMTKDIDSVSPVETQLEFTQDSFITVEVEGPASAAFEAVLPGFVPFAFSNPIFVDADGDDQWTPPGL
jgi:hypothetical protein